MTTPDFDDLVDPGLPLGERERLRRTHDALLAAGPPSELPRSLAEPPHMEVPRLLTPRRAVFALAAALAAAAFGTGYIVGDRNESGGFQTDFVLRMSGTAAAKDGLAVLVVGAKDEAGNWPMQMTVTGLVRGRYELMLTRKGKPAASCGAFFVNGRTIVYLNAPFKLRGFDGWVVTPERSDRILLRTPEI